MRLILFLLLALPALAQWSRIDTAADNDPAWRNCWQRFSDDSISSIPIPPSTDVFHPIDNQTPKLLDESRVIFLIDSCLSARVHAIAVAESLRMCGYKEQK